MKNTPLINELRTETLNHKIQWKTINDPNVKLMINGTPLAEQYQHINPNNSYFGVYKNQTYVLLYGEILDLFSNSLHSQIFLNTVINIEDNQSLKTVEDVSQKELFELKALIEMGYPLSSVPNLSTL
ncbi:hypothetical protein BG262_02710 [Floricoccus penangensis]|uniref:Uncharacterized protein n=1 Tax=Floricoccus penangensis TaxID=1859475 RepID=A0A9Q5JG25_9LACT|nr:hypothetical protein [Floricoccus penangensis]OFI46727.1 hypothetical protein BG262_02710 [Floricoccus penangensis]